MPYNGLLDVSVVSHPKTTQLFDALISVSLDSDQKLWKKFLEKDPPEWAQYVLSKEAMRFIREAYRMPGIPRFMLVNPEGYLVNFKYTRPSDPQCAELIEQDMKDNK